MLLATNWLLELLYAQEALGSVNDTSHMENISSFQERITKYFVIDLKSNSSSCFTLQDVVSYIFLYLTQEGT